MKKISILLLSFIVCFSFVFVSCNSDNGENLSINNSDNQSLNNSTDSSISDTDLFTKLKQYVIQKGNYDSKYNDYTLTLGYRYSPDNAKYTRKIRYSMKNDDICLLHYIEDYNLTYLLSIYIDEFDGVYEWTYINTYDEYMYGTLYATIFHVDYLLESNSDNLSSSSRRLTIREHASSLTVLLLLYFNSDLTETGITLRDLGFLNI